MYKALSTYEKPGPWQFQLLRSCSHCDRSSLIGNFSVTEMINGKVNLPLTVFMRHCCPSPSLVREWLIKGSLGKHKAVSSIIHLQFAMLIADYSSGFQIPHTVT